ncbi:MAG: hypothetical protein WCI89_01840 [bacterium]
MKLFSKLDPETLKTGGVGMIVCLVGLGAFGLGRLSDLIENKGRVQVYSAPTSLSQPATPVSAPGKMPTGSTSGDIPHNFVASKNGSKYYAVGCFGISRIKPENQVWFATATDADAAGYTLASSCNK